MTKLEELMKRPYKLELIEDPDEGGFVDAAKDAKRVWLEAALEDGYEIPDPISQESYSGQFKFRLPKSLHKQLSEHAKQEGVSMNQYCLYLLTKYDTAYQAEKRH